MEWASALSELGKRLGIGSIELDGEGGCELAFDDDLIVDIECADDARGVFLSAAVGIAPHEKREIVFAELLEANLHGRGTGRCSLALDGDLDEIILSRYIDRNDIELHALEEELEAFLQMLEIWRKRHGRGELGNVRGGSASPDQSSIPREGIIRA